MWKKVMAIWIVLAMTAGYMTPVDASEVTIKKIADDEVTFIGIDMLKGYYNYTDTQFQKLTGIAIEDNETIHIKYWNGTAWKTTSFTAKEYNKTVYINITIPTDIDVEMSTVGVDGNPVYISVGDSTEWSEAVIIPLNGVTTKQMLYVYTIPDNTPIKIGNYYVEWYVGNENTSNNSVLLVAKTTDKLTPEKAYLLGSFVYSDFDILTLNMSEGVIHRVVAKVSADKPIGDDATDLTLNYVPPSQRSLGNLWGKWSRSSNYTTNISYFFSDSYKIATASKYMEFKCYEDSDFWGKYWSKKAVFAFDADEGLIQLTKPHFWSLKYEEKPIKSKMVEVFGIQIGVIQKITYDKTSGYTVSYAGILSNKPEPETTTGILQKILYGSQKVPDLVLKLK